MSLRIRTTGNHPNVVICLDPEKGFEPKEYCGYSWCDGSCGNPALILKAPSGVDITKFEDEYKTHSNMVACGPVFQRFRVAWKGAKVELPVTAGNLKNSSNGCGGDL